MFLTGEEKCGHVKKTTTTGNFFAIEDFSMFT